MRQNQENCKHRRRKRQMGNVSIDAAVVIRWAFLVVSFSEQLLFPSLGKFCCFFYPLHNIRRAMQRQTSLQGTSNNNSGCPSTEAKTAEPIISVQTVIRDSDLFLLWSFSQTDASASTTESSPSKCGTDTGTAHNRPPYTLIHTSRILCNNNHPHPDNARPLSQTEYATCTLALYQYHSHPSPFPTTIS